MQVVRDLISRFLRTSPDTFGGKRWREMIGRRGTDHTLERERDE